MTTMKKPRYSVLQIDGMSNQEFWSKLSVKEINKYYEYKQRKSAGNYNISAKSAVADKNFVEIVFTEKHHESLDVEFQKNVKETESVWGDLEFGDDGLPMFDDEKGI